VRPGCVLFHRQQPGAVHIQLQDHLRVVGNGRKERLQLQPGFGMTLRVDIQGDLGLALQDHLSLPETAFSQHDAQNMQVPAGIHIRIRRGVCLPIMRTGPDEYTGGEYGNGQQGPQSNSIMCHQGTIAQCR